MKQTRRAFVGTTAAMALAACARKARISQTTEQASSARAGSSIGRRPLGRTGTEVSMIGLGGYHLGTAKDRDDAVRMVHAALDRGIDFLDNCWAYHKGRSEEWMGHALRGGHRKRAFLMSKIDGRTKESARAQIDQSLMRLGTDVIDLMQLHEIMHEGDAERIFGPGGAIEALIEAKQAGKIRFVGFTGHKDPSHHLRLLERAAAQGFTFDTVQMPLNVLDAHYRSFEQEVLPRAQKAGTGIIGMKALASGEILEAKVVSAADAQRYALSLPIAVLVVGCSSMSDLDHATAVATGFVPLEGEERSALLARTAPKADGGAIEKYKTTTSHDSTTHNPHWLDSATL
jgi:aryl-alcohol dehydrogenase-like predicted oxidoreductase